MFSLSEAQFSLRKKGEGSGSSDLNQIKYRHKGSFQSSEDFILSVRASFTKQRKTFLGVTGFCSLNFSVWPDANLSMRPEKDQRKKRWLGLL